MSKETIVAGLMQAAIISDIEDEREKLFEGFNKDADNVKLLETFFDRGVGYALATVEKHLSLTGSVKLPDDDEATYTPVTGLSDAYWAVVNS